MFRVLYFCKLKSFFSFFFCVSIFWKRDIYKKRGGDTHYQRDIRGGLSFVVLTELGRIIERREREREREREEKRDS